MRVKLPAAAPAVHSASASCVRARTSVVSPAVSAPRNGSARLAVIPARSAAVTWRLNVPVAPPARAEIVAAPLLAPDAMPPVLTEATPVADELQLNTVLGR